jgi:hypothetical protein
MDPFSPNSVAVRVLPDFPFLARRDEFSSGESGGHAIEGSDAGAVHGQDGSDRQSPMRGERVTMRFGNFLACAYDNA